MSTTDTERVLCPLHQMPDCSPLLNGCSRVTEAARRASAEVSVAGLRIEDGWLVEESAVCICAGGTEASGYQHEPGCGPTPLQRLDDLPGWPGTAPRPATEPFDADRLRADVNIGKRWTGNYAADSVDDYYPAMDRLFGAVPMLLDELARLRLISAAPRGEDR